MFGGRRSVRTTWRAAARCTRRRTSAWVSASTRFVVTTRAPARTRLRSASARGKWAGWRGSTSGYHALVSTNSSAGTAAPGRLSIGSFLSPLLRAKARLGLGKESVVVPRGVVRQRRPGGARAKADDLERRVLVGVQHLPLERFQRAPQDVGLGGVKLVGQALEPPAVGAVAIDLNRLPRARGGAGVDDFYYKRTAE